MEGHYKGRDRGGREAGIRSVASVVTVGLVIEYKREEGDLDSFQWYCDQCDALLYEVTLDLEDIVTQLPPLFETYWNDIDARTCKLCGSVQNPPS